MTTHREPRGITLHDPETDTLVTLPIDTEFLVWVAGELLTVRFRVARGVVVREPPVAV